MDSKKISFLVLDDNDSFRMRMRVGLEDRGFEVYEGRNVDEGVKIISRHPIRYAVVDLRMPGGTGLDFLKQIQGMKHACKILILTGYGSIATATQAIHLGAVNYLQKPVDLDDILRAFNEDFQKITPRPQDIETPSLEQIEWEHIQRVLEDCDGNITQAAKKMGMHRRTLQRKLKKYAPIKRDI